MRTFFATVYILLISATHFAYADCGINPNPYLKDIVKMESYELCNADELETAELILKEEMSRKSHLSDVQSGGGERIANSTFVIAPYKAAIALIKIQKLINTKENK